MRGLRWIVGHCIALLRVFSVLVVALFLPQLWLWNSQVSMQSVSQETPTIFKLGVENVTDRNVTGAFSTDKPSIALITNHTGIDQEGNLSVDVLLGKGLNIKKILFPQETNKKIYSDSSKHIPKITLQAKNGHKILPREAINDVDIVMVDMQDSGMHYYGFTSLILDIMKSVDAAHKKCVVLDRPNLLGWCMEGFCKDIPTRYGMTIGELAHYYNSFVLTKPIDLQVIPMSNYNRSAEPGSMLACSLSSNIKNIDSCYGYSFLGLLGEVAPFDIGIGTDKAFQCMLLPDSLKFPTHKWQELDVVLHNAGIESKPYRYYSARKKQYYSGLRLHIHDINHFSSFKTLLSVLTFFKSNKVKLQFSPSFDKAIGSGKVRLLMQDSISYAQLTEHMNNDLQSFFKKACGCFIYKPYPKMVHVS